MVLNPTWSVITSYSIHYTKLYEIKWYDRPTISKIGQKEKAQNKEGVRKNLLFRVWPVLYGHNKRLDYKIYEKGQKIDHLVRNNFV